MNKNKKIIIITIISLIVLTGIYLLYNTYALTTKITNNGNYYTINLTDSNIVSLAANEEKTVICQINNTNNGTVSYGVAYNNSNIEVKVYSDSKDKVTGTIGANDNKYVKLHLKNKTSSNTTVEITAVMGYENGGDLIVPSDSTLVTGTYTAPISLAKYITNLYTNASKSTVTNNSITYNYATSESLMNDRLGGTTSSLDGGNIRYYGASPKNYVYFNCETYPSTNCELWRIIGVFDGKIKLIRNGSIGSYSWDTSVARINSGFGIAEWSQADIMKVLNPNYDSDSVGGSLYYNSKSGNCYNGQNNATISCDFTSTGIKNEITKKMIANFTWNFGMYSDSSDLYSNQIYVKERGTNVFANPSDGITRTSTWNGKIALPHPSDYGYATDFLKCTDNIFDVDETDKTFYNCGANDWMLRVGGTTDYWLLVPNNYHESGVNLAYFSGYLINATKASYAYGIIPTLYLEDQILHSGDGSQSNPYQLKA